MTKQFETGYRFRRGSRAQQGQTIVIALLVLLLMAFLGGLFASIVTRNLQNAGRANRVQTADYYAESGIRFADEQLTFSTDGADWRPPLQYALANPPADTRELARYNAQNLGSASQNDPDKPYLDLGFTRYNIGGGRFLLRVTYDPAGISNDANSTQGSAYSDPLGRYIKIESIGREGTVDPTDPTTFTTNANRLNATLIQYKAIGISDYALFVTNPNKRSDVFSLGVSSQYHTNTGVADNTPNSIVTPGVTDFTGGAVNLAQYPVVTTYGAPDAFSGPATGPFLPATAAVPGANPGGGSIRVNGSVRFYGANDVYLNYKTTASGFLNDTVQVAGNLILDNYQPTSALNTGQNAAVVLNPDPTKTTENQTLTSFVAPSNSQTGFDTHSGAVRDGSNGNDIKGQPRNVNRLEPPTLDSVNPATNLTRYRDITENAALRTGVTASGASKYGYGQAIYIDNSNDVQQESSSLVGGYTLIDEWLHRTDAGQAPGSKFGWTANFYRPPGVDIVLARQVKMVNGTAKSFYGVRLTRSDVNGAGGLIGWNAPDGNTIAQDYPTTGVAPDGTTQSTMTVSYDEMNAGNDPTAAPVQTNPNNDVIIYAEGNVRLRGVVSADPNESSTNATAAGDSDDKLPRHITIVTNGTAYIDGSLLRGNPESSIQVLAHDYVCVNTTQFLAGAIVDENPAGTTQPAAFADAGLRALDFGASDQELLQEFSLPNAIPTGTATTGTGQEPFLYVSGGPSGPGATAADFDILNPRTGLSIGNGAAPFTNPVPYAGAAALPFYGVFNSASAGNTGLLRTTFDLGALLNGYPSSFPLQLAVRRDPGEESAIYTQDFLLERAAILPGEVRIEAGLFAQTRSFFVIPGEWFNSSSDDNVQAYAKIGGVSRPGIDVAQTEQNRFPFFGQPIDMKITIDGSVAEAEPADITAQTAWMLKWGWVPQYHGGLVATGTEKSPFAGTNAPGVGLNIIYNPLAGFPYYTNHYLRMDAFGRPLPFAPKLPVCTGLLYAGQNTSQPVVQ